MPTEAQPLFTLDNFGQRVQLDRGRFRARDVETPWGHVSQQGFRHLASCGIVSADIEDTLLRSTGTLRGAGLFRPAGWPGPNVIVPSHQTKSTNPARRRIAVTRMPSCLPPSSTYCVLIQSASRARIGLRTRRNTSNRSASVPVAWEGS